MPHQFPHACTYPGCRTLVTSTNRCPRHVILVSKALEAQRGSASARGYGRRWQGYRERYLREHPLCVACERSGRLKPANEIDHVTPHRGDYKLMWDPANHQALCKPCHSRKTATEDSAFATRSIVS